MSSDLVSTSFKLPEWLDKALPLLAELDEMDSKSEYIRTLIEKDLMKKMRKSELFAQLNQISGVSGMTKDAPGLPANNTTGD